MESLDCNQCQKTFRAFPCQVKNGRKFCSNKCAFAFRMGKHAKHGAAHRGKVTRLYRIWCGIVSRCEIASASHYMDYGGRGISMCKEWRESFTKKKKKTEANGYRDDLTIDRIDGNGNYEPVNCRWASRSIQARNKGKCRVFTTSRLKGVSWHSATKKWQARIFLDGKSKYLGVFDSQEEAAKAYDSWAKKNFGEYAGTNFTNAS